MTEQRPTPSDELKAVARTLGIPTLQRHIFLCCDQTKPECCDTVSGLASWEYLITERPLSGERAHG